MEIGSKEIITQKRLLNLFRNELGYTYLGDWYERGINSNIEEEYLQKFLKGCGLYSSIEIDSAVSQLKREAGNVNAGLYHANKAVYNLLRYGANVSAEVSENKKYVHLIDWANPLANDFYVAEEVTIKGRNTKRPDIVIYVNGIALGVIELKRSTVSIHQGIRQNLDNQSDEFIPQFFTTIQLLFAGNETEGLHYGAIKTPEKFWLRWKEYNPEVANELDRSTLQMFNKKRFLEFIHDCIVFDGGTKKVARPNQYFGLQAAHPRVRSKESGIIWHSQGSGKSLTMIWLAKWIRENIQDARVVIITDRDELDKQIESGFKGVDEKIVRTKSGTSLISKLNEANPWLMCTLIHKFGYRAEDEMPEVGNKKASISIEQYLLEVMKKLPQGFSPKGNIYAFIDECHRTQGGMLHEAMKAIMGENVMMIGFTGTPLLKTDKKKSIEVFGSIIHSYKFDEAVADHVILDLRYDPRDVEQYLGNTDKIDDWFETKTSGLSAVAKSLLKERWARMEKLFSSKERMQRIVADICQDMDTKRQLLGGYGNAMLVSDSIYQACRYWELFQDTDLKGHCAVVTSYEANAADIKNEATGAGDTEEKVKYEITKRMMGDKTPDQFEDWAKDEFIKHPATMKLLIVVDKLLTGFDAPSATYLYIDKKMRDHNLFQAICRVNRVDSDEKDYGYIVDYQDLFGCIKNAIEDYTSEAFDGYEKEDVENLLTNRLVEARKGLEQALQAVVSLCEVVEPQTREGFFAYFVYKEMTPIEEQSTECQSNAEKREKLYKLVGTLVRRYIDLANEMKQADYSKEEAAEIKKQVDYYNDLKDEIKLKSGDALDLKFYDPAMRQLIDNYVRAKDSVEIFKLEDISFLDLVDKEGESAIDKLPADIKGNQKSVAETLVANMRKMIINERPNNPAYFDKISEMLNQLLQDQKDGRLQYQELVSRLINKIREVRGTIKPDCPAVINTPGKQALYDNLDKDVDLALKIHETVITNAKDDWRDNAVPAKKKKLYKAIRNVLPDKDEEKVSEIMNIISAQKEY
ncbi:MAG: HsdR family type I site-specific deoxyribonuclease [Bacteroidales bacterium]|nr:HsdR family type I site-specific deoxyribonuclease [Bacteroidales bacterium]